MEGLNLPVRPSVIFEKVVVLIFNTFGDWNQISILAAELQGTNMKKIDWYILKKFLSTFVFSLVLLTVISVVIDMSERTDDFAKNNLDYKTVFSEYYSGFIPFIVSMLFPLFVFISVIFFTSKMAGRSEFIAILASGVSLRRILRPYMVGGVLLAFLLWMGSRYIIPRANERRTRFEAKYFKSSMMQSSLSHSIYMRVDSFSYCGIRYYDTTSRSGGSFFMQTVRDQHVTYNLRSDNIIWDTTRKSWKLTSVVERSISGMREQVAFYPELYKTFNFKPSDLQKDEYMQARLTSPELERMIELDKLRGSESVKELMMEAAHRNATPVAVIILTLIGAILATRKIRGGSGVHLALGIIICAVFILTDRFSTIFSTKGDLNPYIAAWIPNVVFSLLTIYLYRKAPK
jgi:lipopolysaccharide export system permease protein